MSSRPKTVSQTDQRLDWTGEFTQGSEVEEHKDNSIHWDAQEVIIEPEYNEPTLKPKRDAVSRDSKSKTQPKRKPWMI